MPSKSPKQARLMRAAAADPAIAKKAGVPTSVAKEYVKADAGTGVQERRRPPTMGAKEYVKLRAGAEKVTSRLKKELGRA